RVLRQGRASDRFISYWERQGQRRRRAGWGLPLAKGVKYLTSARGDAKRWADCHARREGDYFLCAAGSRFLRGFRGVPLAVGLSFAFEVAPRLCLQLNGGQLPFGCHAWPQYDRQFWQAYLLP